MPIEIEDGVRVIIEKGTVTVSGPKGELKQNINPEMKVTIDDNFIFVERSDNSKKHRSLHGLTRTLINNMVIGVKEGFQQKLEIVGVGYRAEKVGDNLVLRLGFSHTIEVKPLSGINLNVEGANRIIVSGIDKEKVGRVAAEIRSLRPPDSYKGKGVRYAGEIIHLKAGKAVGKT
jgi:large subunit ribosomal protein L6